jgi:hypothetical protein
MLDRLLYRNVWHDLINQRLLDEGFWNKQRHVRPLIAGRSKKLSTGDYAADWEIRNRQLYLCAARLIVDNSDLLERLFPGRTPPIRADWFTGGIDATGEKVIKELKFPRGKEVISIRQCKLFMIINGKVIEIRNSER